MTRLEKLAAAVLIPALLGTLAAGRAAGAGVLTPKGSPEQPIRIKDHSVRVVVNNGFARTEVNQTFHNPNDRDLEAIYSFPVPESASLSEVSVYMGEKRIDGEVVRRKKARRIYEQEKRDGNETGLAEKNGYQSFEFAVSPVRAGSDTRLRFVYYQPLKLDTGVGRYLYPLEEGGTDEMASQFWTPNTKVEGTFSAEVELKSAWPVADVRVPGFGGAAQVERLGDGHFKVRLERQGAKLEKDFVFYYRLEDKLPGRVEVVPYRAAGDKPGTFMLVVTPGIDLGPLSNGADYSFVLDISGSMEGKIHTLADGVSRALGQMRPEDRFKITAFESRAIDVTRGWQAATPQNVQRAIGQVKGLRSRGSTNLYDGIKLGLKNMDADRATSVVLVTDAVTNTGVVKPKAFHELMKKFDVRVFGFLMGNSANWPLMRTIADASGGFYAPVSNQDDIIGQILLAKSKITHECLHDASLKITGAKVFDAGDELLGKVYRGQQLVIFGRYSQPGRARVTLKARLTGQDKTYTTSFDFPEIDTDNPEIERLWAMDRIGRIEVRKNAGLLPAKEAEQAIADLGVSYQLVTDHTSMLVLSDDAFKKHGIDRHNRARTAMETQARAARRNAPVRNYRVDGNDPAFANPAPRTGGGGGGIGAVDPAVAFLIAALVVMALGVACTRHSAERRRRQ